MRGQTSILRDPAAAIAAAKCWLARWNDGAGARFAGLQVATFHPRACDYCSAPPEALIDLIENFLVWSGIQPPERFTDEGLTPLRADVEGFLTLPQEEQEKLVQEAQGYIE